MIYFKKLFIRHTLISLFSIVNFSTIVCGQFNQFGNKMIGTGAINNPPIGDLSVFGGRGAQQGRSISFSKDGQTLAVGAPGDSSGIGSAYIYKFTNGNWIQYGNKLVGSGFQGYSHQGSAIALSGDGNTLAVGGSGDDNYIGATWIYTFTGTNWSQIGNKIVGAGADNSFSSSMLPRQGQGNSVSLSNDGKILAIGNLNDSGGIGAVWTFSIAGNNWTQIGNKIIGSGYIGGPRQGASVSLSGDGRILAIGGQTDNSSYFIGAAWVFTFTGTNWSQMGSKLVGSNSISSSNQGRNVCISENGRTLAVSGSGDNYSVGAVWMYTLSGSNWIQMGEKLIGSGQTGSNATQGYSISLSKDGNTLAVGGNDDNNGVGATWIFRLSKGVWSQYKNKLIGTGIAGIYSYQGSSVSFSGDGKFLAIGGSGDDDGNGAFWVFTAPGWIADTVSAGGGTTDPLTSDTLSISGTVHQGSGLLTDGIVMAIEKSTNKSKILRVTNGNFKLDSLAKGNYILYAIPNPVTVTNYLPTFYVNKVKLKDAVTLSLQGHIRSVDIYLAALNTSVTGTYTITGRFSYEDGNSRDSSDFKTNWFGQTNAPTTPIAVTTNTCNTMPVLLYNSQNSLIQSTVTDTCGYFTFKNLPPDAYKVLGQRNKYASKNEGLVVLGTNGNEIVRLSMESVVTDFEEELSTSSAQILTYPNPFNQEIQTKGFAGEISVVDVTGKLVLQTTLQENETISTTSWPAGFYILKAGNTIQKLIKKE